jgi:hypothetical protein
VKSQQQMALVQAMNLLGMGKKDGIPQSLPIVPEQNKGPFGNGKGIFQEKTGI